MKLLLNLYLISLSMLSAYAVHPWVPIPMAVGIISVLVFLVSSIKSKKGIVFSKEDILLFLFLLILGISLLLNDTSQTNINHAFAFTVVILVFYFGMRNLFFYTEHSLEKIFKWILVGVVFSSVYAIIEFLTMNFLPSFSFVNNYIYRPSVQEYTPTYNELFIRARSFTEESGVFALFLNAFAPLAIYYVLNKKNKIVKILFCILVASAYTTTFSAGGVGFLVISLVLTLIFWMIDSNLKIKINLKRILMSSITLFILIIISIFNLTSIFLFLDPLFNKLTLVNDSGRFERWNNALDLLNNANILQFFFGTGPGQVSEVLGTGTTSFYIDRIVETGFIGFTIFSLFIFVMYIKIRKIKSNRKYLYFCSLTSIMLHFLIISNYWFPYLWTILILIHLEKNKNSSEF